jgi:DNA-binding GntR family transcriptional regulator
MLSAMSDPPAIGPRAPAIGARTPAIGPRAPAIGARALGIGARDEFASPGDVNSSSVHAHERLRRAIVRLELPPGTAISEQQLGERFGLSKAAVRAALARLRAERLVLAEPRRGHVVAPLTLRDVSEVYALRLLLEPPAAAAAAGRLDPATVERLRRPLAAPIDVADAASVDRFLDSNRAVHVTVARASGNGRLAAIVERLLDDSERAIGIALRAGAAGGGLRVREEHEALLEALALPDAESAQRLMHAAIERFRDELLATLRGSPAVQEAALTA